MTKGANVSQWVNNREIELEGKKREGKRKKGGTVLELSHNPDGKLGEGARTVRDRDRVTGMNSARGSRSKQKRTDRGQVCREGEDKLGNPDGAKNTEHVAQHVFLK